MWQKLQIGVVVFFLLGAGLARAQRNADDPGTPGTELTASSVPARLLSLDEGLAVLGAAMETAHHRALRQDCSHFVHQIYDRAGFPYSYETSTTLYQGTSDFQRVTQPQPGDLIVWRGHMGIIVNPVQHSFFSSLRTGFGVEKYDSRYWRKRGRPRFYRYVKIAWEGLTLAAAAPPPAQPGSLKAGDSAMTDAPAPPVIASTSLPVSSTNDASAADGVTVVISAARPTPELIRQALEDKFSGTDNALGAADLLNATKPVVIVENFQVKKVHVKRDQGWAEVDMNEPSSLAGGQAHLERRSEKRRWPIYRYGREWHLEIANDAIYLPKDTAVRLLAHELASITGRRTMPAAGTQHEAQLARLLDRLLGE